LYQSGGPEDISWKAIDVIAAMLLSPATLKTGRSSRLGA
jgi:hypothetical protein